MESLVLTLVIIASAAAALLALRTRRERIRLPVLTLVVMAVTFVLSVSAELVPVLLGVLSRDPSRLASGDWWRIFTPLLVQDGGWIGTLANTVCLLLVGTLAESLLTRPAWAVGYFASGLLGELVAYTLLPHQGFAGNSIAIMGLAAMTSVVAVFRGGAAARIVGIVSLVLGTGMLLAANLHGAAFVVGAVAGLIAAPLMRSER